MSRQTTRDDLLRVVFAIAAFAFGLVAAAASMGFLGRYLDSLPAAVDPFGSASSIALLVVLLVAPVSIELMLIEGLRRTSSSVVRVLLLPALVFIVWGWVELLRVAPRLDHALSDGPGAWITMFPVLGVAVLYAFVILLPVAVIGVHLRHRPLFNNGIERTA